MTNRKERPGLEHPDLPTTKTAGIGSDLKGTEPSPAKQADDNVAAYNPFPNGIPQVPKRGSKEVARYTYTDESRKPLSQVRRFEPGKDGKAKSFTQHGALPNGRWAATLNGARKVLYHLPQLIEAVAVGATIYIPEGERDVESLEALGQVATCNPMGAGPGKWLSEFNKFFEDADVVIVSDWDTEEKRYAGQVHAATIYDNLIFHAERVRIVRAKTGKDVTDHIDAGHILAELVPVARNALPAPTPAAKPAGTGHETALGLPEVLARVLGVLKPDRKGDEALKMDADYEVCCPVHDDKTPSATVKAKSANGLILFNCHAGCTQEAFNKALVKLGIPMADLMSDYTKRPSSGPVIRSLVNVKSKAVHWLWPKRIAFGKIANFEGDPEHGKSLVTIDLGARATHGGKFPDGVQVECSALLFILAEDDFEDTVIPRLDAANADRSVCFTLEVRRDERGNPVPFTLPDDTHILAKAIAETKEASGLENVILIVDPVSAYLSEKINTNNDSSVRRATSPLAELAQASGAAIWLVRHLNKNSAETNVAYRGGGSIGFFAAARHVFVFGRDKEDPSRIIMAQSKNNIGPRDNDSLIFHIEAEDGPDDITLLRVVWEGVSDVRADQLLLKKDSRTEAPQRNEVEELLGEMLHGVASIPVDEVMKQAGALGISKSTVNRAAKKMGVISEAIKGDDGKFNHWIYRWPKALLKLLDGGTS